MNAFVFNLSSQPNEGGIARLVHIPKPVIKPNHVLVKVRNCGVNPVDAKYCVGDKFPAVLDGVGRWFVNGKGIGFDFSGVVEEVHSDEGLYRVGDQVYGAMPPLAGSFREYVLAPTHQIAIKPANISFAEAAALPLVGLTSIQCLKYDRNLSANHKLLLIGASGGVGHVALQLAKAIGAHVTAVCSERNINYVESIGADDVIDYTQGDAHIIHQLRKSGTFDMCFDCVTSLEAKDAHFNYMNLILSNNLLTDDAKYITIGSKPTDWLRALTKRTIGFNLFGRHELFWVRFPHSANALKEITSLVEDGVLHPRVSKRLPFTEGGVNTAFTALHDRRVVGKIILEVSD